MKLTRLRLRNFRCYKSEITFDFDNLTALIGRNDGGKSSVMDALDIFLNDSVPDKNDASKNGDASDLTIICEFSELPNEVVIDEDFRTTFRAEHLLNAEGRLEIHKTYSGHTATPKCNNISAFALHPTAQGVSDLLKLKNADLKKRAKELNIDLSSIDPKINAQVRSELWKSIPDLKIQPVFIPLNEENAKKVWEGIKIYIPAFALFKSDRESTDQDPEAQDPLKIAVREALKQKESELNALFAHIENEVKNIAQKTLEKIREMDPNLAKQLNPQITNNKWESLFKVSITGDEGIPINKRGSGVRRLILLNFFRAKAEQQENTTAPVIYAVEEPETSQHPHNQRLLMGALTDLATDNQVIITTHTPMLARMLPDTCLRYIHQPIEGQREVLIGGEEANILIANSLGVLPDHSIKIFVGVEGKHDIGFLKAISGTLHKSDGLPDLEAMETAGELIFFPLGGTNLALWSSRLAQLNRPEYYIFDRDNVIKANKQQAIDEINKRHFCKAIVTVKREMENYIHFEAINTAYQALGIATGIRQQAGDEEDVTAIISNILKQLGYKKYHENHVKEVLNKSAVSLMTKEQINQIDPNGEIISWFQHIRQLIEFTGPQADTSAQDSQASEAA